MDLAALTCADLRRPAAGQPVWLSEAHLAAADLAALSDRELIDMIAQRVPPCPTNPAYFEVIRAATAHPTAPNLELRADIGVQSGQFLLVRYSAFTFDGAMADTDPPHLRAHLQELLPLAHALGHEFEQFDGLTRLRFCEHATDRMNAA